MMLLPEGDNQKSRNGYPNNDQSFGYDYIHLFILPQQFIRQKQTAAQTACGCLAGKGGRGKRLLLRFAG